MENYEGDVKKGKSKWMLWAIIGIVAVVVIVAVVALKPGGDQSNAQGLTIDDLSAQISTLSTTVTPIVSWKATATEDIANLKSKVNALATPKDWTADFAALGADITALRTEWATVNQTIEDAIGSVNVTMPRYAMVSLMAKYQGPQALWQGDIFTNVEIYGQGNYPVIVTFYGDDLGGSSVYYPMGSHYTVSNSSVFNYDCGGNVTSVVVVGVSGNITLDLADYECTPNAVQLVVFVIPTGTGWEARDTIQLGVSLGLGSRVDYAIANVGGTWLLPAVPTSGDWPI